MVGQYEKLPERILMDLEAIADEPGMEMLKLIFIFFLFTFFIFLSLGNPPGGPDTHIYRFSSL